MTASSFWHRRVGRMITKARRRDTGIITAVLVDDSKAGIIPPISFSYSSMSSSPSSSSSLLLLLLIPVVFLSAAPRFRIAVTPLKEIRQLLPRGRLGGDPKYIHRAQGIHPLAGIVDRDQIIIVVAAAVLLRRCKDLLHSKGFCGDARDRDRPFDARVRKFVLEDGTAKLGPGNREIPVHEQPREGKPVSGIVGVGGGGDGFHVQEARKVGGKERKHAAVSDRSKEFLTVLEFRLEVGLALRKDFAVGQGHPGAGLVVIVLAISFFSTGLQEFEFFVPHQSFHLFLQQRQQIPPGWFAGIQAPVGNGDGSLQASDWIEAAANGHGGNRSGGRSRNNGFGRIDVLFLDEAIRHTHVKGQQQTTGRKGKADALAWIVTIIVAGKDHGGGGCGCGGSCCCCCFGGGRIQEAMDTSVFPC